jgi:ABC-type iron transport system FetAB permease component
MFVMSGVILTHIDPLHLPAADYRLAVVLHICAQAALFATMRCTARSCSP